LLPCCFGADRFGEGGEPALVVVEFVPHLAVQLTAVLHAGSGIGRIKRGEVGEFEVDTVGVAEPAWVGVERVQGEAVEQFAKLDDPPVGVVDQPGTHVEVQGKDQLVALPRRVAAPAL
jgi:hypothetical protein